MFSERPRRGHGELDYTIRREESSELSRNEEPEPVGAEGDRVNPFFQSFSVVRTKSRFIRTFKGGAGVDIFYLEPEPKKKYLEP